MAHIKTLIPEMVSRWWNDASLKVKGAVVYMDNRVAESLHWNGGVMKLLSVGAKSVRELSPFERGHESDKKAVFIVFDALVGDTLDTIATIVKASMFQYCIVITVCSPSSRMYAKYGQDRQIYEQLLDWMGNENFTAEVFYIPLNFISVSSGFFLIPQNDHKPLLLQLISHQAPLQDFDSLPLDVQLYVKSLVGSLHSLFEAIHVKEDIFSVGNLSRVVGDELEHFVPARNRRKSAGLKVSLLLVDRILDLAGPLSYATESFLDKILRILPPLPGHHYDIAVDMSSLCKARGKQIAPGCIAQKSSPLSLTALNHFVTSKHKECLMELNRLLVEAARNNNITLDISGKSSRLTAENLAKRILSFKESPKALESSCGLLQQVLAVVQTLLSPQYNKMDELLSTEKLLIQNATISRDGPVRNLIQLIQSRKEMSIKLEDIFVLIILLYSLAGGDVLGEDEEKLKAEIVGVVFQDSEELPEFLLELVDEDLDENNVIDAVDHLFECLQAIGSCRKDFRKYKSILEQKDPAQPAVYKPFLKQLLEDIVDPSLSDLPHIEYHSGGLTDKLKSGFGFFMNVSKPLPRDSPVLVILVLGGTTATEVKLITDFVNTRRPDFEVLICSTNLIKPPELLQSLFARDESVMY